MIHWWYKSASHAAELTAGYYNTDGNDAYGSISAAYAKIPASIDFTCMEMQDDEQEQDCDCGPFELVDQVKTASAKNGIRFGGENALPRYDSKAFGTILTQAKGTSVFTYLRLSDTLLQPDNWAAFTSFVSKMNGEQYE